MDYSTPTGKFMLVMQGGLAELYSDNLSEEVKKGLHERRKQGFYHGSLPFGAMKGKDGIPVPDADERMVVLDGQELKVRYHDGCRMAFDLASQGKTNREIAIALNAGGYRTTGAHGAQPFSTGTVKDILRNRFYIGEIPDGNGGWLKAKHEPLIDPQLFEEVQKMRGKNSASTHKHASPGKGVYSLTGIAYCWYCREKGRTGRIHVTYSKDKVPRLGCYNRTKGWDCPQKSGRLDLYEDQIRAYLEIFHIPEDYQQRILEMHQKLQDTYDVGKEQKQLQAALGRLRGLYKWGDIDRDEYQREKVQIESQLTRIIPFQQSGETLQKLADYLISMPKAWDQATPEQRNKLIRLLFHEIWLKDKEVVAVKPQPEFEPFFELNWEEFSKIMKSRVGAGSTP